MTMPKKYEKKDLEFKYTMSEKDAEAGVFTGYLSIFDVVDSYGDVVKRGAFKKTIKDKKGEFPILWSHDIFEPIGLLTAVEDEKGLSISGQLNLDVQRGREIRSLMAQRAIKGLSIGYHVVSEKPETLDGVNVRALKEIDLWEGSPCVFQATPGATITGVKSKLARVREAIEEIDPEEIGPEQRAEVFHNIESLIALHGKQEPPAGTPAAPAEEPPVDSDLMEAAESFNSSLRDLLQA
jgi:HK97 family phage prohead protease